MIFALNLLGQNYIGMHKSEIFKIVPQELSDFVFDNEVVGKRNFIKFVNQYEEQTLLCILDKDGVCTSVSRMYNTWMYDKIRKDLKNRYAYSGVDTWTTEKDGAEYEIVIKRGQWFLTVTTRKKRR